MNIRNALSRFLKWYLSPRYDKYTIEIDTKSGEKVLVKVTAKRQLWPFEVAESTMEQVEKETEYELTGSYRVHDGHIL